MNWFVEAFDFTCNSPQQTLCHQNAQGAYHMNALAAQQNSAMSALNNQQIWASIHSTMEPTAAKAEPLGDCEGCGAPMKRYRACCEYCRRAA